MKEFKEIYGNRVYLLLPKRPESKLELPPEAQHQLDEEFLSKLDKLKVFAIGDAVTKNIKEGDLVFIDPHRLSTYVKLKLRDMTIMIVSEFDIMHKW